MSRRDRNRRHLSGQNGDNPFTEQEDINPNAYIVNLADCMLVLAVGFMVALVSAWSVNLPSASELDTKNLQEVQNMEKMSKDAENGSGYEQIGKVYQDPSTGKTYILEDADKTSSSSSGDTESSGSSEDSGK